MKKYFITVTYPKSRNTITLHSKKDFRKCKEIKIKKRRLLVVTPEQFVDLTGATVILMGKKNRSYD